MAIVNTPSLYEVPAGLVGITPGKMGAIPWDYAYGGQTDELLSTLGMGANQAFATGQQFAVADLAGQPGQWVQKYFKQVSPYAGAEAALAAGKPITEQAYAERQRQLEGEKDPLMARYQALLDELTRREGQDIGQNTLALAREYGKRGVPLSSGVYEQNVLEKTRPIREFYGAQGKEVGFEREDKLRELGNLLAMLPIEKAKELNMINQQIAALKAQGATQGMQMAWEAYKFQREEYWKQQELDLRKQAFELQKWEAEQPEPIRYQLAQSGSNFYAFDPVQGALQMLQGQFGGDEWERIP